MPDLYLDHAATSPPLPEALAAFADACTRGFANPGSLHQKGADAARILQAARKNLKKAFGADSYQVIWTGTGTEANHLGIQGFARAQKEKMGAQKILIGAAEHPAARMAARALEKEGFEVQTIPVDSVGILRPEALAPLLAEDVALISIQWANNELGGLNPIRELVAQTKAAHPSILFHTDAIQAAGKRLEGFDDLKADAISTASHKIGGIRGCAALFIKTEGMKPQPLFQGGGHESGLRAGTENVMGAAAFAAAADVRRKRLQDNPQSLLEKRNFLLQECKKNCPDLRLLGPTKDQEVQGSILTLALPNSLAEPLLHRLEADGMDVGSGSACSAKGHEESPVLSAIQFPKKLRNSVLRFSLDGTESEEGLRKVAEALKKWRN
jgi:cysteine desulfurase